MDRPSVQRSQFIFYHGNSAPSPAAFHPVSPGSGTKECGEGESCILRNSLLHRPGDLPGKEYICTVLTIYLAYLHKYIFLFYDILSELILSFGGIHLRSVPHSENIDVAERSLERTAAETRTSSDPRSSMGLTYLHIYNYIHWGGVTGGSMYGIYSSPMDGLGHGTAAGFVAVSCGNQREKPLHMFGGLCVTSFSSCQRRELFCLQRL